MALSMDEQRMLAEIERRLAAEDPGLAARLSSFRRPGPATVLRSSRVRIVGSVFTVALVAAISLVVYAMVPFRAHAIRPAATHPQSSPVHPVLTAPGATGNGEKLQPATTATTASAPSSGQGAPAAGNGTNANPSTASGRSGSGQPTPRTAPVHAP